jgi:hypothetical protein
MKHEFRSTFENLRKQYILAIEKGYEFLTCEAFFLNKDNLQKQTIINRVDIDFSVKKAERLGAMFNELGIKATFFIRLHAPEYNPFSFENYRVFRSLIESGHEVGYHSEIIDQAAIWDEDADKNLIRDIEVINNMFGIQIAGVASHGGLTGLNNLDFWKTNKAADFGLLYEAYDWFDDTFYISDSGSGWKAYEHGRLLEGDQRSFGEHIEAKDHDLIYLLLHPIKYFDRHYYE